MIIWMPYICMWLLPDLVSTMDEPIFGHFELLWKKLYFNNTLKNLFGKSCDFGN